MVQSSTRIAGRAQQVKPTLTPVLNTAQPGPDSSVPQNIHYLEEGVQEDAKYQVQWSNWMSGGEQKSFYAHVFVLLLSWHPECDDMAVEEEVKRLKDVFENKYNYEVQSFRIDSRERSLPQAQANLAVANFVNQNDQDDTLFIIYYAGHGSPGKDEGHLKMSGRRRHKEKNLGQQYSHITWNFVEGNLKTTRADVFLIFDCCYASDLGRESALTSRSFEYLAASESNYTRSPGPESFTSALIWALEKLAPQSARATSYASPMFTTSKLAKTIYDCPDFPKNQKPSLTTRDIDAWQHIILAPLPREGISAMSPAQHSEDEDDNDEEDEIDKPIPQFLSLTFHFKQKQDETELKRLADHLKKFMKAESTSLQKVQWGGFREGWRQPRGHRLRQAVLKVMSQSPTSASKNSNSLSRSVQGDRLSPQMAYNIGPPSTDERTPLLSDASSVTFEESRCSPSLWNRIKSLFRGPLRPAIVEPQANTNSNSARKLSKSWTSHLKDMIFKLFHRSSSRIQISS